MGRRLVWLMLGVGPLWILVPQAVGVGATAPQSGLDSPQMRAQRDSEAARLKREADRRATPEARAARRDSRVAFHNLAAARALDVAREKFDAMISAPAWSGPRLGRGERIKRYLNDGSAEISTATGTALMESTIPLVAPDSSGVKRPVDLGLTDAGAEFRSVNPVVAARFPKQLGNGPGLSDVGVTVRPAGALAETAGLHSGDKVFYPNAGVDTDFIAAPVPAGVETFLQLRSATSPEEQTLNLDLPAGATLQAGDSPDTAARVVRGGNTIAVVSAPMAQDADGQNVPLTYAVRGHSLVITVPHQSGDWAYPIMVDPLVEDFRYWHQGQVTDFTGWQPQVGYQAWGTAGWNLPNWNVNDPRSGFAPAGLYVQGNAGWHVDGEFARWIFPAQGTSYIYHAEFYTSHWVGGGYPAFYDSAYQGIVNAPNTAWDPGRWWDQNLVYGGANGIYYAGAWQYAYRIFCGSDLAPDAYTACGLTTRSDGSNAGTPGNVAQLGIAMNGNGTRSATAQLWTGGAVMFINDRDSPTNPQLAGPLPASGWVDSVNQRVAISAQDSGLGMSQFKLFRAGNEISSTTNPCFGNRAWPCPNTTWTAGPGDVWTNRPPLTYNTDTFPEGDNVLDAYAYDTLGNRSAQPAEWHVKVDRTGPTVGLSGTLPGAADTTLGPGDYTLHVAAQDGTPNLAASGVKSLEVVIDGEPEGPTDIVSQDCPTDSCSMTRDFSFAAEDYYDGNHTIAVVATDQMGHTTTMPEIRVTVNNTGTYTSALSAWKTSIENAVGPILVGPLSGPAPSPPTRYQTPDACTANSSALAVCFDSAKPWEKQMETWLATNGAVGPLASNLPDMPEFPTPNTDARELARASVGAFALARAVSANPLGPITAGVSFHGPMGASYISGLSVDPGISSAQALRGSFDAAGESPITAGFSDSSGAALSDQVNAFYDSHSQNTADLLEGLNANLADQDTAEERTFTQAEISDAEQFQTTLAQHQPLISGLVGSVSATRLSTLYAQSQSPIKAIDIISDGSDTDPGAILVPSDEATVRADTDARTPQAVTAGKIPKPGAYTPSQWRVRTKLDTATSSYPYIKTTLMMYKWTQSGTLAYFRGDKPDKRGFEAEGRPAPGSDWSTDWSGGPGDRGHSWDSNMPRAYIDDLYKEGLPPSHDNHFAVGTGLGGALRYKRQYFSLYKTNRGKSESGDAVYAGQATRRAKHDSPTERGYCAYRQYRDSACFFFNGQQIVGTFPIASGFHTVKRHF